MINLGKVAPGRTIRIPFSTFDKDDGSSITMTNYAAADILIYKDGSTTERASTAGFTATTDFDSKTGKHVAIIDLADNTTAGFFAAGSEYLVAIDAVTVDGVTTGGWIGRFTIGYEGAWLDTTIATLSSQTSFTLTEGPAEDDALNGHWAIIHDVASAVQKSRVLILDYTGSTKTITLAAGATFTAAASDNFSVMGMVALQPTTIGRTLDVSSGGEAGIDWANIGSPTTTVAFTGTTIATTQKVDVETIKTQTITCSAGVTVSPYVGSTGAAINGTNVNTLSGHDPGTTLGTSTLTQTQVTGGAYALNSSSFAFNSGLDFTTTQKAATLARVTLTDTVTTYTGNTPQTGDSYAIVNSGTHGNAAIKGYVDDIGTAGAGLTAIPWNAAWDAEVQSEVQDAIEANNLDHLVKIAVDTDFATTVHLNSVVGHLADNGTSATFDRTTDSLESVRDRGDAAWITATGFSTLNALDVRNAVGLASANLDTQLADIPTVSEFNARTLVAADYFDPAVDKVYLGNGAHGGVAAVITFERMIGASTTTDEPALKLTGNGDAAGMKSIGGASGNGVDMVGLVGCTMVGTGMLSGGLFISGSAYSVTLTGTVSVLDVVTMNNASNDIRGVQVNDFTTAAKVLLQTEANDALVANNLDHLVLSAVDTDFATTVHLNSVVGHLADNGTSATFDRTTDSLEAIRDRGDAAWTGGAGSSDWTADEKTAIRSILGVPVSGTTPDDPTVGILDTIRDKIDVVDGIVDSILVDTGTTLQAELDGIQADTEDIQTRLPAALVSGRIDASVGAMAANTLTASALASDAVTEIQSGLATSANQTILIDGMGFMTSVLMGTISDAGTAGETYVITFGGATYTLDFTGLDSSGNRTGVTRTKT